MTELWPEMDRTVNAVSAVARTRNLARYNGAGRDWRTPPEFFAVLDAEFGFEVDVCASPGTEMVARYFSPVDDGLRQTWAPWVCWMNPPYGRELPHWTAKAVRESQAGALVVGLLPAATDQDWWHRDVVAEGAEVRYVRGRLKFLVGSPVVGWASPFVPVLIVVWRP